MDTTDALYQNNLQTTDVEIDWEEYFKEFCKAHGQYPILYNDVDLLFHDGWRYSASNYEGPEYPPPTDKTELNYLLLVYWKRRYQIVKLEYDGLEYSIAQLKEIQRHKDRPLYQRVTYQDDTGKQVTTSQRLDLDTLNKRLNWLKLDKDRCSKQIDNIESDIKEYT